jgi:hypothetical protein
MIFSKINYTTCLVHCFIELGVEEGMSIEIGTLLYSKSTRREILPIVFGRDLISMKIPTQE